MEKQRRDAIEKIVRNIKNTVLEEKKVVEENEEYFLDDFDYDMIETFKRVAEACDAVLEIMELPTISSKKTRNSRTKTGQ